MDFFKRLLLISGFAFLLLGQPARAADPAPTALPPEVALLLQLLQQPGVQEWLAAQEAGQPSPAPASVQSSGGLSFGVAIEQIRRHLGALGAAVPQVGPQLAEAWLILSLEFEDRGLWSIVFLLIGFLAIGSLMEKLFWMGGRRFRSYVGTLPFSSAAERLKVVGLRFAFGLGLICAFALGSVGLFVAVDWPILLREIVLAYLFVFLAVRTLLVASRVILAPSGGRFGQVEKYRILPMENATAWFVHHRIALCAGLIGFAWASLQIMDTLGVSEIVRLLLGDLLALVLLALLCEALWRLPSSLSRGFRALATGVLILLWVLWVSGDRAVFWTICIAALLPLALLFLKRAVAEVLRGAGATVEGPPILAAVAVERGLRAALFVGAILALAATWNLDYGSLADAGQGAQLLRGLLSALIVVLVGDFIWRLIRGAIDLALHRSLQAGEVDAETAKRNSRLRTLLPILRNIALVVVGAVVILMALSTMGVEIGPLIAGAGVVGVAVGFGAQTLVKDIISGIFYLFDDAFRVGEYIQSAGHKGTVESFSLRSLKLRHHRGPLTTVPFGELGAIQNMSRDWVIDKLTVGVTYDSNLELAKKLIKQIGKQLAEDPEHAKHILEPMKMQGVEQFGDFAIQLRMKMMTRPGEQFVIRRKALAMIKKAFDANGISFAYPTVRVAGEGGTAAAVAQQGLPKPPIEEA